MGDCMVLYENSWYNGLLEGKNNGGSATVCSSQQWNCVGGSYKGACGAMPCIKNNPCKGADIVSSFTIDDGMVASFWTDDTYRGKKIQYKSSVPNLKGTGFDDSISSFQIQKDCGHIKWLKDMDCNTKAENTTNHDAHEELKRKEFPKRDLSNDLDARDWCFKQENHYLCKDANRSYCANPANTRSEICKTWGSYAENKPTYDLIAEDFCKANIGEQNFCGCFEENARYGLSDFEQTLLYGGVGKNNTNNRAICWSKTCGTNAHMTSNMTNSINGCPKCYQVVGNDGKSFKDITNSSIKADVIQSCSVDSQTSIKMNVANSQVGKSQQDTSAATPVPSTAADQQSSLKFTEQIMAEVYGLSLLYWILIFAAILFVGGMVINKVSSNNNRIDIEMPYAPYY